MHMQNSVTAIKNMQFMIPQDLAISEMKLKFAKNMAHLLHQCIAALKSHPHRCQGSAPQRGPLAGAMKPLGFDHLIKTFDHCVDIALLAHQRREETQGMGSCCIEQKALAQRILNKGGRINRLVKVDGVHEADAANLFNLGHAGKLLTHILAGFLHMLLKTI